MPKKKKNEIINGPKKMSYGGQKWAIWPLDFLFFFGRPLQSLGFDGENNVDQK